MNLHTSDKALKSSDSSDNEAYIYTVMPFHIIAKQPGDLFDTVADHIHHQDQFAAQSDYLMKKLQALIDKGRSATLPGDHNKYYDFMRHHFGGITDNRDLSVFQLETSRLVPSQEYAAFKNMHAQFAAGAHLGKTALLMHGMDELTILVNSTAGIGFFIFGFECSSTSDNPIAEELAKADFFRNIGWRRNQKLSGGQIQKHSWIFDSDEKTGFTMYATLQCYLSDFSDCIRFYQDRPTVFYSFTSKRVGSKSNNELCELAYEIIRIPDRNAGRFEHALTEPQIHRVGRNVAFTALNEGALVIETINESSSVKVVANKYFPAFILALNQREILLGTMKNIVLLETQALNKAQDDFFNKMERLRNSLLILQLKQIFYSVSNLHEVELFFNQLQKSFAVEKMLMENEQCIREMYNLLEVKRNKELERIENENAEKDERRSNIINTILGAIGCLGLFSFLKDLIPFYNDVDTYGNLYRPISVLLPLLVMAYIVKLVFFSKK